MSAALALLAKLLAGYVGLTAVFYMLSLAVPRAGFVARVLASYVSVLSCAIFGVVSSAVLTLAGHQQISQWVVGRAFHHTMRWMTGVVFDVVDPNRVLDTLRPAVFIGNHQTELDVLMLGAMFPKYCSVTAKSDLRHVPFLGWFMRLSGSIFIDRKNSKDAREAMQGAANEIRSKRQSVYMFPEGTRSYAKEPELLPFKKGAFYLAIQARVPIVPCVVANYSHILYLKSMVFRAGHIPIKGQPPPRRPLLPPRRPPLTSRARAQSSTPSPQRASAWPTSTSSPAQPASSCSGSSSLSPPRPRASPCRCRPPSTRPPRGRAPPSTRPPSRATGAAPGRAQPAAPLHRDDTRHDERD